MKFSFCMCLCIVVSFAGLQVQGRGPLVYFRAELPSDKTYGLQSTIVFSKVEANVGSGYNPSSGVFHVPIAGLYLMKCQLETTGHGSSEFFLESQGVRKSVLTIGHYYSSKTMSVIIPLKVGDHVLVRKTYGIPNAPLRGGVWSQFSGYLLRKD
ncbi:multimerin-1-like isoform X2 [Haliotis cracherodii]|uniref:multimerin-1-like isoform X2 n=1 Tax=Haliotis cracherodii TaxID=6455 RepID=UPI0039E9A3C7